MCTDSSSSLDVDGPSTGSLSYTVHSFTNLFIQQIDGIVNKFSPTIRCSDSTSYHVEYLLCANTVGDTRT